MVMIPQIIGTMGWKNDQDRLNISFQDISFFFTLKKMIKNDV